MNTQVLKYIFRRTHLFQIELEYSLLSIYSFKNFATFINNKLNKRIFVDKNLSTYIQK
ncbi:hypothetical protein GS518_09850 [Leptospira interrogans]|nr:hypothetical protein [Leptospira interrogans serovar Copenhageni]QHH32259.1 hypothetical protein GS525_09890 [Leptospira interrogans]QHH43144.1 hypothetical protein GS518_09850 [Leptospira interrogans]QHH53761.1 hypothetical protein GS513_09845 [Leptospira interrogans]QHH57404.1 hypothetical protein GS512_09855 [Leptospira interrogans]